MGNRLEETAVIIAQSGPLNNQRWSIVDNLTIGRDSVCEIVIPDRQVSRQHARFSIKSKGIFIEDLSSKNGTHCNGVLIKDPILLQDGDIIQIALTQDFLFLSSDATVPLELNLPSLTTKSTTGCLRLDKRSRRVWIKEKEVLPALSLSQFQLLSILYDQQGEVVARKDLITAVWQEEQAIEVSEQALDALIRRLRDRLLKIDPDHSYIITIRGHGLRLDNPQD
jgi:DNA-binding winged helix-turn-helix (wHTH) protein